MADPGLTIRNEIFNNWGQFGTIRVLVQYKEMGAPSKGSDGIVSTPEISAHNLYVIFAGIDHSKDYGQAVFSTDRDVIFPVLSLPIGAKIDDILVDDKGVSWKVKSAAYGDPAFATWSLLVRPGI